MQHLLKKLLFSCVLFLEAVNVNTAGAQGLPDQVVVRRTVHGVPHIKAENMRAAGYAMGYLQLEDYGKGVAEDLVRARGQWARYNELSADEREGQIDRDAAGGRTHARALETYPELKTETRDLLEGFAAGVNRYIGQHPGEFPDWIKPDFTGQDVHAMGIEGHSHAAVRRFLQALHRREKEPDTRGSSVSDHDAQGRLVAAAEKNTVWARLAAHTADPHPDAGSNAWALAPGRTVSGKAILLRNPHLSWDAGYYEAHMEVPGKLNFYGDFRIGGPLGIIGGFNERLGWATTNNNPDTDEIYAFEADPERPDHFLLDGKSHPLRREQVTVEFRNGEGLGLETREFLSTPFGPVIYRGGGKIYVIRAAREGGYRTGEQFLQMMMASNLEEWKAAMRIQARTASNFTYADADGNIFYVWNGTVPDLPHPSGRDTTAVPVSKSEQIWTDLIAWDELPQLENPQGGYLHNENDPFHYTNLNEVFDPDDFPAWFPPPRLRLRTQHSLELIGSDRKFSLEDIVELKHSMRMLLAGRVKSDLVTAVRDTKPTGEVAEALRQIEQWDNTVSPGSRGGVLFELWWERYVELGNGGNEVDSTPESAGYPAEPDSLFAQPWSPEQPTQTPQGLASPRRAAEAFTWAVEESKKRYGGWDLTWGDVHRARIGDLDLPVGGGTGDLGCFRVLWFTQHKKDKQKLEVRGGDGWVLAVEFGDTPRAYSILAYGQSTKEDSPYFNDQLDMFVNHQMKPIAFTEEQIREQLIQEYHPGREK